MDSTSDGVTIGECVCHLQHACTNPLPGGQCCGFGSCSQTQDSMIEFCTVQGCGSIGKQCTDDANCCYDEQITAPPNYCGANAGSQPPITTGPCVGQTVNFPVPDGHQVVCHVCGDPNPANTTHVAGTLIHIPNPACVFYCASYPAGPQASNPPTSSSAWCTGYNTNLTLTKSVTFHPNCDSATGDCEAQCNPGMVPADPGPEGTFCKCPTGSFNQGNCPTGYFYQTPGCAGTTPPKYEIPP